jgi:hypothetical protein
MIKRILSIIKTYFKEEDTHQQKLEKLKKQHNKEVNIFIGDSISPSEIDAFFGPKDQCIFLHYTNNPKWSAILRDIGIAESLSQANGSGWNREVEDGFQDIHLNFMSIWKGNGHGLHPNRITILKTNYEKI